MNTPRPIFRLRGIFKKGLYLFSWLALCLLVCGLAWPNPPEREKIKYLHSFTKPEELKITNQGGRGILELFFGQEKNDPNALVRPQGIFSRNGLVLVTDTALGCVHIFNSAANKYFKIKGSGQSTLISPVGVTADQAGKIYVSDSLLKRVLIFSPKGTLLGELGAGKFLRPCGLAIDQGSRRIFAVDTLAGLVKVFDPSGDFIFQFGGPGDKAGSLNHPTYLALDPTGDILIVDSLNSRVQRFSGEGKYQGAFGKIGRGLGQFSRPKGIALDSERHIYVTDSAFDNTQIFDPQGKLLLFFGASGNQAGNFWLPAGIAIDENDKIYVADSGNSRVQVFQYLK